MPCIFKAIQQPAELRIIIILASLFFSEQVTQMEGSCCENRVIINSYKMDRENLQALASLESEWTQPS